MLKNELISLQQHILICCIFNYETTGTVLAVFLLAELIHIRLFDISYCYISATACPLLKLYGLGSLYEFFGIFVSHRVNLTHTFISLYKPCRDIPIIFIYWQKIVCHANY